MNFVEVIVAGRTARQIRREFSDALTEEQIDALFDHIKEFVDGIDAKYAKTLRTGGCPFCGERSDLVGGEVEMGINGNHAGQDIECGTCGKMWSDNYILLGFDL